MKPATKWDRRKELLVVLPGVQPLEDAPRHNAWAPLLNALSAEWRVFLAYAPREGLTLPVGSAGPDPLPLDTMEPIRRALTDQLVSGAVLVGQRTVLDHIERLHSFSPHIPFFAALEESNGVEVERLEFVLGWSDGVLLSRAGLKPKLEPVLRRARIQADVVPQTRTEVEGFASRLSRRIQERFLQLNSREWPQSFVDWIGYLGADSEPQWHGALAEWRSCLPKTGVFLLIPNQAKAQWRGRIKRMWRDAVLVGYGDEQQGVDRANQFLARARRPRALLVTTAVRLGPMTLERMATVAASHPLTAAVCPEQVSRPTGEPFGTWSAFSHAWHMRHRGGYRPARDLQPPGCVLLDRSAVAQSGALDPRLGWDYAIQDLGLRVRQNGWNVFTAEDAVVSRNHEPPHSEAREAFKRLFLRKWTMDSMALINGHGPRR